MVPHHEIIMRLDDSLRQRAVILKLHRHISLHHALVVHIDFTVIDAKIVSRQSDDAFDIALRVIAWIKKNHDITTMNIFHAIDHLVDEEAVLVLQHGQHAGSFDPHRLVEKDDDECRYSNGDYQISQP